MSLLDALRARLPLAGLFALAIPTAFSASLPEGVTEVLVANGLNNPTAMQFAPDGRLFVCQQGGELRVIQNGALLPDPFVSVTVDPNGERGLLGVAFDPGFATNNYVYIYYTATMPEVHNRVSRFTANGNTAIPGSESIILELDNLSGAQNHNGGAIHFGADGRLYIATGENATTSNSQTLANLLGKLLRINPDGTIPTDNPFYNTASGNNRAIYALGFRNPFTFAIQPGTGRIFMNDVGEGTWEEINDVRPGANYGWPNCEGDCNPPNPSFHNPIFFYRHGGGDTNGNSIAGGAFYNPATNQFPVEFQGVYFFAEFVNGWIRVLNPANGNAVRPFATGIANPVDLKVGADGRLYYLARGNGSVFAVFPTNNTPQITLQPENQIVKAGEQADFAVNASGALPLSYQWLRNGTPEPGANGSAHSFIASQADDGAAFRCVVTNLFGAATSNPALLILTTNNRPAGTITAPQAGTLYEAGDTVQFAGMAGDPEDGALPDAAFSWTIVFHHDVHTHPFLGPIKGVTSGSFTIPTLGETAAHVWYRIHLTVTDSGGRQHRSFEDINPRTSLLTLQTVPAGLQVTLDGQPVNTPASVASVVGIQRTLGVVSPQSSGGTDYEFAGWSDGGTATHGVSTPASDTSYTARFITPTPLVPRGATWKYLDNGSDQGVAWRAPGFNDAVWASGPAELGYGDATDSRPEATMVSFGGEANNKHITTYFRRRFDVPNPALFGVVTLRLLRDDGAVVYLNGTEIRRDNLPGGNITFTTPAGSAVPNEDEAVFFPSSVDPGLLTVGTNTLAVEIHQANATSSDISFDLSLDVIPMADLPRGVALVAPANNTTFALNTNVTLRANASAGPDASIARVDFFVDNVLLNSATTLPFTASWNNVPAGLHTLAVQAVDSNGLTLTSAPVTVEVSVPTVSVTLITNGSVWKYLDNGSNQGTGWRARTFNDGAWASGRARLGYGGNGEVTLVSFGGAASNNNKHITTYFRHAFHVPDASAFTNLNFRVVRDDGVVVYLNGAEVFRQNMPGGVVIHATRAGGTVDNQAEQTFFPASGLADGLVDGTNVLAAEIHQVSPTSSDIGFDLEMTGVGPGLSPFPQLSIQRSGNSVVISWPVPSTVFALQSSSVPGTAGDWAEVSEPVTTANGRNNVTVTAAGERAFFRLVRP
jgi:glucose/arabinose dehydrogenase